uniref:Uncharacterized protein n=1 Tax=Tetranychus urticae TaxID=32264 RepID=T1JYD1_TETUR
MKNIIFVTIYVLVLNLVHSSVIRDDELYIIYEKVYLYNVTLFTTSDPSKKFESVEGQFLINLEGNTDSTFDVNNYLPLDQKSNSISFNESYMFLLTTTHSLETINKISIKWTGNDHAMYLNHTVYVDKIVLQLVTERIPIPTKIFCGQNDKPTALEPDKGELMTQCSFGPLNWIPWLNFNIPSNIKANLVQLHIVQH